MDDNCYTKKWLTKCENLTLCISFFFVGCVDSVLHVCAQMVAILHIETFVTFDFNPSLISKLITDSNLDQIKRIFGHKQIDDWATEQYK